MKFLVAFVSLAAIALAVPVSVNNPEEPSFQFRSTGDVDGSYSFSYAAEDSSKSETRKPDGTIIGGYQYIDVDGILQKIQYKAGKDGVQILASNLPVGSTEPVTDTPEIARATEEHFHAVQKALQLIARAKVLEEEYERKQALKKLHVE